MAGAVSAANARAPVTGGQFAAWAALLRTFECGIEGIRQKQDPWNLAISAAITHGILAARGGIKAATKATLYGGAVFTLIPAIEYLTSRHASYHNKPTEPQVRLMLLFDPPSLTPLNIEITAANIHPNHHVPRFRFRLIYKHIPLSSFINNLYTTCLSIVYIFAVKIKQNRMHGLLCV